MFPQCPSCRQVTGPKCLPQPDTIFQHTSLLQIGIRIPCSVLSQASVSNQLGKCQTLIYVKACRYVGQQFSPLLSKHFPSCLCNISNIQYELLLLRERLDSPASSSQCLPQMVSLNQRKQATLWQMGLNKMAVLHFIYFHLYTLFNCIKKIVQSCRYVGLLGLTV